MVTAGRKWMMVLAADRNDDSRAAARSNVFLTGVLDHDGRTHPVRVRNISRLGALLEGKSLPPAGLNVCLRRGHLFAAGEIAWDDGDWRGIRFKEQVDVPSWIRRPEHQGQRNVDEAIADLRSSRKPIEGRSTSTAAMLTELSSQLCAISERLASTSALNVELAEDLIRLDTIAQQLRSIASGH
jgi:hypothetical protein